MGFQAKRLVPEKIWSHRDQGALWGMQMKIIMIIIANFY